MIGLELGESKKEPMSGTDRGRGQGRQFHLYGQTWSGSRLDQPSWGVMFGRNRKTLHMGWPQRVWQG